MLIRNIEEFLFYHSLNYQAVLDIKNVLIYLAQGIIHVFEVGLGGSWSGQMIEVGYLRRKPSIA